MERFFWMMYDHFKSQDEAFIKARHKGKLSGCVTAISNTSISSMEVWNYPDTTSMQVSTLILFHMLRMFILQGTFAVVHFAAYLPRFAAYLSQFAAVCRLMSESRRQMSSIGRQIITSWRQTSLPHRQVSPKAQPTQALAHYVP